MREALALERVLFVPAHRQPLKRSGPVAPAEDRLAMLRLAVADHPAFEASPVELERGSTSYTADTLAELAARHPGAGLTLIMGSDAFALADRWRRFDEVRRLARIVVVERPAAAGGASPARGGGVAGASTEPLSRVEVPALAISASEIRRRLAAGLSIRYLVPEPVRLYIAERGLYR